MSKAIYPVLFVCVLALATMQWTQHRGSSQLMAWLEPKTVQAQSPDDEYVPAPSWPYTGSGRAMPWPASRVEPSGPRPEVQEPPPFEEPIHSKPPPASKYDESFVRGAGPTPQNRPTDKWDENFVQRNLEPEPRLAARPGETLPLAPAPQRLPWAAGVTSTVEGTLLRGGKLEVFSVDRKPLPVTRIQLDQTHWPPTAHVVLQGYLTTEQGQGAPTFIVEQAIEPRTFTILGKPPAGPAAPPTAGGYDEYPSTGYTAPAVPQTSPADGQYGSHYEREPVRPAVGSRYAREQAPPPAELAETRIDDGPGSAGISNVQPEPTPNHRRQDPDPYSYRQQQPPPRQTESVARRETVAPRASDVTPQPAAVSGSRPWIEDTVIVAIVNSEAILAGDVRPMVDAQVARNINQIPPDQLDKVRKMLMSHALEPIIRRKLLFQDARRDIPQEAWSNVQDQLGKHFDERVEMIMQQQKLVTLGELEAKLASEGQSLEQQKRTFFEETLARQWLEKNSKVNDEVGRDELLYYYRTHSADYEFKAKARWQQITIRKDKYSNRQEALYAIGRLGNRVIDGEPFESVARDSDSPTNNGQRDWTTQGSLVSKDLDAALFSLPVGSLSQIIEDDRAFHIVRVIERTEGGRKPFEETQAKIREKILQERRQEKQNEYLDRLVRGSHIWRLFGDPEAIRREAEADAKEAATSSRY